MADDLAELLHQASTMPGAVTWASPEDIRRVGTRRRQRNRAAAALALVLVLAAGVTATFEFLGNRHQEVGPPSPTPSPTQPVSMDVPPDAMVTLDLLPSSVSLTDSSVGGRSGPDGLPEGWQGDSMWLFYVPYCDAYHGLNIRGYFGREAIRLSVFDGPSGGINEIVERYPDATAAGAVMGEIRTVLDACGSSEFQATGRADGFAGDDSLRFVDNRKGEHIDWVVVRKGNLIAMLRSPVVYGLDLGQQMAQRLCAGLSSC